MVTKAVEALKSSIEVGEKDKVLDLLKLIDKEATRKYVIFEVELGPNEFKVFLAETPKYVVLIYKIKEGEHKPVYVIDIMNKKEFKHIEEELANAIQEYLRDTVERVDRLGFGDILQPIIPYINEVIKRIFNTNNLESFLPKLRVPLYEI